MTVKSVKIIISENPNNKWGVQVRLDEESTDFSFEIRTTIDLQKFADEAGNLAVKIAEHLGIELTS